jgi:hypothetical protein
MDINVIMESRIRGTVVCMRNLRSSNLFPKRFMGTDALQHRESIGRFYCLARTVKNSKRLTL